MARSTNAVEINKFVGGLVTEATPLNFPDNASIDEDNFVLNIDGSRERRLGMDFEDNFQLVNTSVYPPTTGDVVVTSFRWRNAGGDPLKNLIAVQIGNELKIFDMDITPLSSALIYTKVYSDVDATAYFSYATVDGLLTIANGLKDISTFEYIDGAVTASTTSLLVRDLFGLEDAIGGTNLRQGSGVSVRPATTTNAHTYNLRNQTFATPRRKKSVGGVYDPIDMFKNEAGLYPSNSDSVVHALSGDTTDENYPTLLRFKPEELVSDPLGSYPAPMGYFIIDALQRGPSRLVEYNKLRAANPSLAYPITSLPADTTPGGATVVAEYSGRVWFSGFSGTTNDGDTHSPRMSSYVLFSQLVEDPSDITSCYQSGDPTSSDAPDLIDTDGGFIRIEGAYGICGMVNVGKALMVIGANGVWQITGGSDYGFKATNYLVNKLTNHGCDSPGSIVVVDNSFMYWGDDGIYNVSQNQFGDYNAENIIKKTIQSLYDDIDPLDKKHAKGIYDSYERKIRWVYGNRLLSTINVKELILDIALGAFYPATFQGFSGTRLPLLVSGVQVPAYTQTTAQEPVTVNGALVTVSSVEVTITANLSEPTTKETVYVVLTSVSPTIEFTFSSYKNENFKDWALSDGVGLDAKAYLVTGWMGGSDFQRNKQVPYVTFHFLKTENGYEADVNGDFVPVNQSSCLVQAQWDWTNSANSNRWGRQFQAYRHRRVYMPSDINDAFSDGNYVVETRSKLRGKGKVLSLLISTEEEKNCKLLGWSMMMETNQNV